ncbi:LysE family translocator [Vibrio sonorensis]|uniref:LysE family translocator n=1 Tax=Vibrio sonorensis TaxID=1004316 RepID=UPI0008DA9A58|nr:LysE family translocator [Vibrio sonorensis]
MDFDTLIMYSVVAFFYIISPGPAVFLAIYNGALKGMKVAMMSAFGNILGIMCLSTISISGLSAILLASSTLFTIIKVVGATYLVYLGLMQIRASNKVSAINPAQSVIGQSLSATLKEGLLVAITNPKPILFFAALFPQFLDVSQPIAPQFSIMTAIFMLFSFCSLTTYAYIAARAKNLFSTPKNKKWFQRISGGMFVGLGGSLLQLKSAS